MPKQKQAGEVRQKPAVPATPTGQPLASVLVYDLFRAQREKPHELESVFEKEIDIYSLIIFRSIISDRPLLSFGTSGYIAIASYGAAVWAEPHRGGGFIDRLEAVRPFFSLIDAAVNERCDQVDPRVEPLFPEDRTQFLWLRVFYDSNLEAIEQRARNFLFSLTQSGKSRLSEEAQDSRQAKAVEASGKLINCIEEFSAIKKVVIQETELLLNDYLYGISNSNYTYDEKLNIARFINSVLNITGSAILYNEQQCRITTHHEKKSPNGRFNLTPLGSNQHATSSSQISNLLPFRLVDSNLIGIPIFPKLPSGSTSWVDRVNSSTDRPNSIS